MILQVVTMVLTLVSRTISIPIDNGVIGTSVQCTPESIAVNFTTRNPFTGRVFVQGMSDRPECVRNYADGGQSQAAPVITFVFGECNMQRTRTLSPQSGMMQTIIVVISFHKVFITKVDRAYKIQCFYMESEKTVTSQLDVSMLTTDSISQTSVMPTCTYTVRRGSRNGDIVRYARVGEAVFHEWECDSDHVRIIVKNCFADDGQGNKQQILDDKGCSIDPVILADLTYEVSGNAKATVESHVFKYADKPTVFFQCTVQICNKGDTECEQNSPPRCLPHDAQSPQPIPATAPAPASALAPAPTGAVRKREAVTHSSHHTEGNFNEMDLLTDPIAVLDLLDASISRPTDSEDFPPSIERTTEESRLRESQDQVCISSVGLSFLVAAFLLLFLGITASAAFTCMGKAVCNQYRTKV